MKTLIIGAAGRVGSAALAACLSKQHHVTAFLRNPAKLPPELRNHPRLRITQGDATSHASLVEAIRDTDAIIQAAVYGSNSPFGTSDSEKVVRCIIKAVKEVQASRPVRSRPIRLWVMSGQVLMDIPGYAGKIEGDVFPIHPEHYKNYDFLQKDAKDVDWSLLCPGRIDQGEPAGPLVITTDRVGLWQEPWLWGRMPLVGPVLNVIYNWKQQRLTYASVGEFLSNHLGPEKELRGKRVGVLEDASKAVGLPTHG
ncbi:MAG: hypothetical protein Q9175_004851 [Cornicularia normoerica]